MNALYSAQLGSTRLGWGFKTSFWNKNFNFFFHATTRSVFMMSQPMDRFVYLDYHKAEIVSSLLANISLFESPWTNERDWAREMGRLYYRLKSLNQSVTRANNKTFTHIALALIYPTIHSSVQVESMVFGLRAAAKLNRLDKPSRPEKSHSIKLISSS